LQLPLRRPRIAATATTREAPVRPVHLACALLLALAACSDATAEPPKDSAAASSDVLKKDCADPRWKEENLGLWYSVCRRPMRW
jgi:hypothetical protein